VLNNTIYIATLLSLEKRRNLHMHRKWYAELSPDILCLIALLCNPVLSWRACVISTFVADNRLGWWNTSRETEVQNRFSAPMLFSFS